MITIERGHDPRSFSLVAFGGAGPVHAGRLAQDLNIERVVVPPNPGVFSATGLVSADLERDYVQTLYASLEGDVLRKVREAYRPMEREAREMLGRSGIDEERWELRYSMDLRYTHQAYELNVPVDQAEIEAEALTAVADRFHERHQTTYGYNVPAETIQLVNLRISALGRLAGNYIARTTAGPAGSLDEASVGERDVFFGAMGTTRCAVYDRARLPVDVTIQGPAILEEASSTIVVYPGQSATATEWGTVNLKCLT